MYEPRAGRPEAAAAIWNPRGEASERPTEIASGSARLRGALQALGAGLIAALLFLFLSRLIGCIVGTIAAIILFSALLSPTGLFATIERGFQALGRVTGRALTFVLMSAVFYLVFLPFGLLFRRGRRDAMKRFYDREASTYWEPHSQDRASAEAHLRQF
jgi:hypothetical protein